jgi:aromatic-L-amino-acid decarboxylase
MNIGMSHEEFRRHGKEMIDYIADYLTNIRLENYILLCHFYINSNHSERRVTPEVEPGYLRPMLPRNAPEKGEPWDDIMKDVERSIMPGITHWQHPRFHAYFPAGNSYPSILAEMLSTGLGVVGFSWAASPACTELEPIMLDWLGRMMSLPEGFLPFIGNNDNEIESIPFENGCESLCGGGALLVNDYGIKI